MMFRLKSECESMSQILDDVKYRAEWIKYQEQEKQKEEEAMEKERGEFVYRRCVKCAL